MFPLNFTRMFDDLFLALLQLKQFWFVSRGSLKYGKFSRSVGKNTCQTLPFPALFDSWNI